MSTVLNVPVDLARHMKIVAMSNSVLSVSLMSNGAKVFSVAV
jgi:hypothetical protein